MRKVSEQLQKQGIRTHLVEADGGQNFAERTAVGLFHARAIVAFCTWDYGQKTGLGCETYEELNYWHTHQSEVFLIPINMMEDKNWPPYPPPDHDGKLLGRALCDLALKNTTVRIKGISEVLADGSLVKRDAHEVSDDIITALYAEGTLEDVAYTDEAADRLVRLAKRELLAL